MSTIGVVGYGFVGKAVAKGFCHAFDVDVYDKERGRLYYDKGHTDCREVLGVDYDKESDADHLRDLVSVGPDVIFVCVPTPMKPDGSCDVSIVEEVVGRLEAAAVELGRDVVAVLKSTVPPGTTGRLRFSLKRTALCFNPEFLTEANYLEDFENQNRIVLGGWWWATDKAREVYEEAFPGVPVLCVSAMEAEMVKYLTNCFLATKVSLANEFKLLCGKLGVDYDGMVDVATKDVRLGDSHWRVPGPDGHRGWGGSCFIKDVNALLDVAGKLGVEMHTLAAAWQTNLEVRPEKDWERLKGRAVV